MTAPPRPLPSKVETDNQMRYARVLSSTAAPCDNFTGRDVHGGIPRTIVGDAAGVARVLDTRRDGWARAADLRGRAAGHHRQSRLRALLPRPCEHARSADRLHSRGLDIFT